MLERAHPGLVLILGAAALPLLPARLRGVVATLLPLVSLGLLWAVEPGASLGWMGLELSPLEPDALSRVFASAFCLVATLGSLFAARHASAREITASLIYAGSALLVVLAGDWLTLFVGWEIMAVGSTVVVFCGGTRAAERAGLRYLAMHALGGVLLLSGIAALWLDTGSLAIGPVSLDGPAGWLLLTGVLINAGAPPVSAWIADAYPEASPTGMVFLSAFTTKSAVYVLLRCFAGQEILIGIGLWMILYGIVYALLENDMRRILAYSIVNQVGFMVVGAGIGTELAINGAASHAFAHLLYKGLLIMSAGSVLIATDKRRCTELGGLWRTMPLTAGCGIVGALAISAFPFTSGFVTKSLTNSAAAQEHLTLTWFVLVAASAGVFLHAGIKFPWFVFFHRDQGLKPKATAWNLRAAMLIAAALCILPGVAPSLLHDLLPFPVDYEVYTAAHVVSQLQLLLFGGLAFFVLLPMLERTRTLSLDWDWLWRRAGSRVADFAEEGASGLSRLPAAAATRLQSALLPPDHAPARGRLTWPLWVSVLLLAGLLALVLFWNAVA